MVSTSLVRCRNTNNSNRESRYEGNFSLVLVLAASTCLLGSAALYFYYNPGGGKDHDCDDDNQLRTWTKKTKNGDNDKALGNWGRRKKEKRINRNSNDNNSKDDVDGDGDESSFDLPQHLQRELYKEERRKASVRFLAMKKPLYENIEMYHPDGTTMLCTIGRKKANWYVRKELAIWRDIPDCHPSIRLLFEPKNSKSCKVNQKKMAMAKGSENNDRVVQEMDNDEKLRQYNCTHKLNICVSCGAKDASESKEDFNDVNDDPINDGSTTAGLMRHYVVPYAYRKLLPSKFKTHLPHDVVLLCLDCHIDAEQAAKTQRTDVYERRFRKDPSTRLAVVVDHERKRIKSYARALWKHKDKLPQERIQQYESAILEHLAQESDAEKGALLKSDSIGRNGDTNRIGGDQISEDILHELALNLEPERKNPKYIPLADLVVGNLCRTDEDVSNFVIGWREFFVETLHPRHLPAGWSVHSPVEVNEHSEASEGNTEDAIHQRSNSEGTPAGADS